MFAIMFKSGRGQEQSVTSSDQIVQACRITLAGRHVVGVTQATWYDRRPQVRLRSDRRSYDV